MESRITIVQALDERDLLIKKIAGRTQKAKFTDLIRPKACATWGKRLTREAFTAEAQRSLQQIQDLIARYDKLNAAIAQSNAVTFLDTSRGRMSVSCAIALRNRLRRNGPYGELTDFEGMLVQQMENDYKASAELLRRKNEALRKEAAVQRHGKAADTRIVVLQSADSASRSRKSSQKYGDLPKTETEQKEEGRGENVRQMPAGSVRQGEGMGQMAANSEGQGEGMRQMPVGSERQGEGMGQMAAGSERQGEGMGQMPAGSERRGEERRQLSSGSGRQEKNQELYRLFDPLDIRRRADVIAEQREELLAELETKIKISNATTYINV